MKLDLLWLVDAATSAAQHLGMSPELQVRVKGEFGPWVSRLLQSATGRWLPVLTQGHPCGVPELREGVQFPCAKHAIGACDACRRPCCLHHARVDQSGGIICFLCVAEMMRIAHARAAGATPPGAADGPRKPFVPPAEQQRRVTEALRVLGVKRGASWKEVQAAHRKLATKHHPDRERTDAARKRASEKAVAINAAFQTLEEFYRSEVAA